MRVSALVLFLMLACSLQLAAQEERKVKAIEVARKSVVSVRTYRQGHSKPGIGSGVILRSDGFILTNYHVVENAKVVKVGMPGGQQYTAKIWKTSKEDDLALLKVEASGLPVARVGNSDKIKLGQTAIAIGDPMGFSGTVTTGTVSGVGRDVKAGGVHYDALIQTDAAINPGSSGGALINLDGQVIGINTLVYNGPARNAQGLGFAIPVNHALKVAKKLVAARAPGPGKPWLGITGENLTPDLAVGHGVPARRGVLVTGVIVGSPAEQSNIQVGDAITSANGKTVLSVADFVAILNAYKPGDTVSLSVWRQGKKSTVQVTLDVQSQ